MISAVETFGERQIVKCIEELAEFLLAFETFTTTWGKKDELIHETVDAIITVQEVLILFSYGIHTSYIIKSYIIKSEEKSEIVRDAEQLVFTLAKIVNKTGREKKKLISDAFDMLHDFCDTLFTVLDDIDLRGTATGIKKKQLARLEKTIEIAKATKE